MIPNAGLPDEDGNYNETPEKFSQTLLSFVREGWVNVLGLLRHDAGTPEAPGGGCGGRCSEKGVGASRRRLLRSGDPNRRRRHPSGAGGERTNVLGSRRFKRLIRQGRFDVASEIGRRQVRRGAHVVDVCLQDPDRDEMEDIVTFLKGLVRKVKAPIMLDSTDTAVLGEALKHTPGKSIINSINLEDGEERFASVTPLARSFGAGLVVGCIDDDKEQAQAITRERKLAHRTAFLPAPDREVRHPAGGHHLRPLGLSNRHGR